MTKVYGLWDIFDFGLWIELSSDNIIYKHIVQISRSGTVQSKILKKKDLTWKPVDKLSGNKQE